MDSNSIITVIGIGLVCIIVILLVRMSKKQKKDKVLKSLKRLIDNTEFSLDLVDYWEGIRTSTQIAIDLKKLWLFFIRKTNNAENTLTINLSEIKKANLITHSRLAGEGKNKQTVIDRIYIELIFPAKEKPSIMVEFYNNEFDSLQLTGELQLAEKWTTLINEKIKN